MNLSNNFCLTFLQSQQFQAVVYFFLNQNGKQTTISSLSEIKAGSKGVTGLTD